MLPGVPVRPVDVEGETVTPTGLTDQFGNAAVGTQQLTLIDTVAPVLTAITWNDNDSSTNLTVGALLAATADTEEAP